MSLRRKTGLKGVLATCVCQCHVVRFSGVLNSPANTLQPRGWCSHNTWYPYCRHLTVTPGQDDTRLDGVVVIAQPFRKPLQGDQGILRRPCQPRVQRCWLPLAHELGKILGERDGVGERGILGCELRQEVLLLGRALLWPLQDEPGRPARGQGAVRRRGHGWQ